MSGRNLYTIDSFAEEVRAAYPNTSVGEGAKINNMSNEELVNYWADLHNLNLTDYIHEEVPVKSGSRNQVGSSSQYGYNTKNRPKGAGGLWKDLKYTVLSGLSTIPPTMANQFNALLNPDSHKTKIDAAIPMIENELKTGIGVFPNDWDHEAFLGPSGMPFASTLRQGFGDMHASMYQWATDKEAGWNPFGAQGKVEDVFDINNLDQIILNAGEQESRWTQHGYKTFRALTPEEIDYRKNILDQYTEYGKILDQVLNKDPDEPIFSYEELDDESALYNKMPFIGVEGEKRLNKWGVEFFNSVGNGSSFWIGTEDATIALREVMSNAIDNYVANDQELQASLAWRADEPFDNWDDFTSLDMVGRGMVDLGGSLLSMYIGGLTVGGVGAVFSKGKRLETIMKGLNGPGAMGTLYFMEGGQAQEEVLKYLTEDYINPETGKPLDIAEALPVAAYASMLVGGVNMWVEKMQLDKFAKFFGVGKASTRSNARKMTDWVMRRYFPRGHKTLTYNMTANAIDLGYTAVTEGLTEGYQETVQFLATEAVKRGYDVSSPIGFNNLINQMGYKAGEIGLSNLVNPYTSNNEHIRQAAWTGAAGFGGGGFVNYAQGGARASWGTLREGYYESDAWNINMNAHLRNKGKVELERTGSIVIVTDMDTGNKRFVPHNTKDEAKAFVKDFENVNETEQVGLGNYINANIMGTPAEYIDLILRNIMGDKSAPNARTLAKLIPYFDKDGKKLDKADNNKELSTLQKLIIKHAKKGPKGSEATLGEKLYDLFKLKNDDGSSVLDISIFEILKKEAKGDTNVLDYISILERALVQEAGKRTKKEILKQALKDDVSLDALENQIEDAVDAHIAKLGTTGAIDGITSGNFGNTVAHELNIDTESLVNFDDVLSQKLDQWFNGQLEPDMNKILEDQVNKTLDIDLNEINPDIDIDDKLNQHHQSQTSQTIEQILSEDTVSDLNDPNASARGIFATLAKIFNNTTLDSGNVDDGVQAVIDRLTGKDGGTSVYATSLNKLLKVLQIDESMYDKSDLGNKKGKEKIAKLIANAIKEEFKPPVDNKPKIRKTRKSKPGEIDISELDKQEKAKEAEKQRLRTNIRALIENKASRTKEEDKDYLDSVVKETLDKAVKDGIITQKEAQDTLEFVTKQVEAQQAKEKQAKIEEQIAKNEAERRANISKRLTALKAYIKERGISKEEEHEARKKAGWMPEKPIAIKGRTKQRMKQAADKWTIDNLSLDMLMKYEKLIEELGREDAPIPDAAQQEIIDQVREEMSAEMTGKNELKEIAEEADKAVQTREKNDESKIENEKNCNNTVNTIDTDISC